MRISTLLLRVLGTALMVTLCACRGAAPVATPASDTGAAVPAGVSVHTLVVDGLSRTYRVYRPAAAGTLPLVVFLHGGFGSGDQAERSYGWDTLADREHVLVAYPDGVDRAWNAGGGCCGVPAREGTDDVAFVGAMVRRIVADAPVDQRRVYATGISNGGMLAYRLACDTTLFAAIAPDSATQLGPCPHPAPVSVVHLHGTDDRNIPYAGGPGDGVARIDGPSVPSVIAGWRAVDACAPPVVTTRGVVTTSVARCAAGRDVELITIAGAGHQWPGSPSRPLVEHVLGLDPPSRALDATTTVWAFLAAHPKVS